jgi:transposase
MEGENLQELVKKQAKIIQEQAEIIKRQAAEIADLKAQIAELKTIIAHLQKDSRNSSKPPSSDIVKPQTLVRQQDGGKKRKIGGQKGHKKHERIPFSPEQVDNTIEVTLKACPVCGGSLEECEKGAVANQQVDLAPKPFIVTEYHRHGYWCPACQSHHTAPLPEGARSGLFSIGLIALVAYLKGRCHISFSALKDFFQEALGIGVSRGFLAKQVRKAGGALKGIHEVLMGRLRGEGHLHIDESGWKEGGGKRWVWAFRAKRYAVFVIRASRGEEVLEEILGLGFKGIISCDFYGAYQKFRRITGALLQLCWAHFIREVLFLLKIDDQAVQRYGRRIVKQIREMFATIHRKGETEEGAWKARMHEHQEKIVRRATGTVPEHNDAQLIAKRMWKWEEEYFRFIEEGLDPTNNPAELTIRQMILDRVVTQGSRGVAGNEWHERFWTVLMTCTLQNISVIKYLKEQLAVSFGLDISSDYINLAE